MSVTRGGTHYGSVTAAARAYAATTTTRGGACTHTSEHGHICACQAGHSGNCRWLATPASERARDEAAAMLAAEVVNDQARKRAGAARVEAALDQLATATLDGLWRVIHGART